MNPFQKISATLASGLRAQSFRMQISSENLANADTHGYRRKLVTFDAAIDERTAAETVQAARVSLDRTQGEKVYDPSHPLADPEGYVVNSRRRFDTNYVVLHRASCSSINSVHRSGYTERGYIKICALRLESLECVLASLRSSDDSFSKRCAICEPA